MADTKVVAGGVPHAAEYAVTADQVTIVGSGTTEDPLHAGGSFGIEVADEGVVLPGGPFGQIDFVGAVTATDAGGGVAQVEIPGGISLLDDGVPISGNPHDALDFVGDGVTVTDLGGGAAQVEIPGVVTVRGQGGGIAQNPHPILDFVGAGVTSVDSGGGVATITIPGSAGSAILTWGYGELTCAADTRLAFIQGGATNTNTLIPPNTVNLPVPFAGTVRNLFARHDNSAGSGTPVTYTVFKNGVATALTVALPTGAAGQAGDTTHSFTVIAGDLVSLQAQCDIDGLFLGRFSCEVSPT